MKTYGYCVGSDVKDLNNQVAAMDKLNIFPSNLFVDKVSGKALNRPSYNDLISRLEAGDLLYIKNIDCLGRSHEEI